MPSYLMRIDNGLTVSKAAIFDLRAARWRYRDTRWS